MSNLIDSIPTVASKAVKVKLSRGTGSARIRDKEAEKLVKQQLGDQGQLVTKNIFKDKTCLIYKRSQLASEMYQYHRDNTLPHTDDGWRILPNRLYMEYTTQMRQYVSQLEQMDQTILATYDQLVQTDMLQRNALLVAQGKPAGAAVDDYPTKDHMARLLYVRYYFEPINTAGDFRFEMDAADKARLNELVQEIEVAAQADMYSRMIEPMTAFVQKLAVPIGDDGSIFRDSLVGNLNDLLVTLPKLNYNDDPHIAAALDDLRRIVEPYKFNPDALRTDPTVRQTAHDRMKELMGRLEGYTL